MARVRGGREEQRRGSGKGMGRKRKREIRKREKESEKEVVCESGKVEDDGSDSS